MIKMQSAYTAEIDDVDEAVAEILGQLDLGGALKNSVGILTCYREYVDTGVVEELCRRVPFDVIGCTTLGNAAGGKYGMEMLCFTVLTSDDVTFSTAFSAPLPGGDVTNLLEDAYGPARARLPGDPSLIVAILPVMTEASGAMVMRQLDTVCGGVPLYGTLSCDHTLNYEPSLTIWNGQSHRYAMAMILMHGNVNAKFYVTALPDQNIQKQRAIITESEGCLLKKVNDIQLLDYLATLGLTKDGGLEASGSVPFMVDYGHGTKPVALGMYSITPEGYAVCGGEVPTGAGLSIGLIDYVSILETAESTVRNALSGSDINGILMFPCLTRSLMISPNSLDEMQKVTELIDKKVPYMLCYAGGEICPIYGEDGKAYNRFHNYTFTACVF
ncbi:MAG: FIST C-terminal domain-containing protein [Synergistaceae bacterium]|nr:FIST C-terminal domain-containing protein [Synergistaceae bacterium]